ncbi:unnamed protein product [Angiostrongylus costaricensis]|uniref:EthD domain-containing protein n=1 Tax=Angiostrongylus costaricensis TaxID=334426 RepID=A0A0R3PIS5_ANGCS|nr:unnamed protein product [Angiostrongylus costaricensis]
MWINTCFDNLGLYALTSNYDEEDLKKFYREDHVFFKAIIGDFHANTGLRRTSEEPHIGTHGLKWNKQGELAKQCRQAIKESLKERSSSNGRSRRG